MPTPFMHLRAAHRFLNDGDVDESIRAMLGASEMLGPFLLGNVAPDARVSGGHSREYTHFFEYRPQVEPDAIHTMLHAHPTLKSANGQQQAFVAGYLAHLAMDVVWCEEMLFPHFYIREWGDKKTRFLILHVLLCYLDERDYRQWDARFPVALKNANPQTWLPFLPDQDIGEWRDVVARQIDDSGTSETVAILAGRVRIDETELQGYLDDDAYLQTELWAHIPLAVVTETEEKMYTAMRDALIQYLSGS